MTYIRYLGWMIGVLSCLAILAGFIGCTPLERHEALCFFFDGVPPRHVAVRRPQLAGMETDRSESDIPFRCETTHEPYLDMKCESCHKVWQPKSTPAKVNKVSKDSISPMKQAVGNGLCQGCHKKVPDNQAYIHGPLNVNACLRCHDPHNSPYAQLLSLPGNMVCWQCHNSENLSEGEHHIAFGAGKLRNDPANQCVTCHDPHESEKRYFLRNPVQDKLVSAQDSNRAEKSMPRSVGGSRGRGAGPSNRRSVTERSLR